MRKRSCIHKNDSAVSLAIVTALIEIQTASNCERFRNLHICLGCYLNYFPFPVHVPIGSGGGRPGAPQAGSRGGVRSGGGQRQAADVSQNGLWSGTPQATCPLAGSFLTSVLLSSPFVFVPSVCPLCRLPSLLLPTSVRLCPFLPGSCRGQAPLSASSQWWLLCVAWPWWQFFSFSFGSCAGCPGGARRRPVPRPLTLPRRLRRAPGPEASWATS